MRKIIFLVKLIMLIPFISYGQNLQNNNWIYGNNALGLNFTNPSPTTFPFPQIPTSPAPQYLEGSASLSDQNGNLILFSDGKRLWKNQGGTATLISTELKGDGSSTQNVIFIPRPGNPSRFYVVTINGSTSAKLGLYYSEVDIATSSMVLPINRVLSTGNYIDSQFNSIPSAPVNETFSNESQSVTSTPHANGRDYWLLAHVENNVRGALLSFVVSCNGIGISNRANVTQEFTLPNLSNNLAHSLKVSPDGSKIAFNTVEAVYFGGFNNTTGAIILNNQLNASNSSFINGYGVEFSPSSQVLFYSDGIGVVARNLSNGNSTNISVSSNHPEEIGLQLARNGKIYIPGDNLAVISNPNDINNLQVTATTISSPYYGLPQWVHWQQSVSSTVVAQNDVFNISSCVTTNSTKSVLEANPSTADSYNGSPIANLTGYTLSVVATVAPIPTSGGITLNTSNGLINVLAGTPSGTYKLKYRLCQNGACPVCSNDAEITVNVTSGQSITPVFTFPTSICYGSTAPTLPNPSDNGVYGNWNLQIISNTVSQSYIFTPTGNPCANPVTIPVTVNPRVTPTFTFATSLCYGATAPALPSMSSNSVPVAGTWSPATVSNTATNNYTFTPISRSCANTVTITVTVNSCAVMPKINCINFDPTFSQNNNNENYAFVNSGANSVSNLGITYTWYIKFYDGTLLVLDGQNPLFDVICPDNPVMSFALSVTNGVSLAKYYSGPTTGPYVIPGFGGASFKTCFAHPQCNDIKGKNSTLNTMEIKVYPNPTSSILKFEGEGLNKYTISIFDSNGNVVLKNAKIESEINLEKLDKGIYIYKILEINELVQEGKVIKN